MAFTDWPLARGSFWPPDMDMGDLFEHLHRVMGAVIGLMSLIMLVLIHRRDSRSWMIKTAWVLFLLIVAQGVLGGVGVLMGEEGGNTWAPASVLHGIMAQPTLCLAAALAFLQSPAGNERVYLPADVLRTARKLCVFALVMVLVQLSIGSVVRHTNQQGMLWLHVFMALFVSASILAATAYAQGKIVPKASGFGKLCYWIMGTLLMQLILGFVTLGARQVKDASNIEYIGRSIIVSSHVVCGAFLFMLATLLLVRVWRVRPDESPS
jgi:cytochrome c oxidase assembly protein subunit 15